MSINSTFLSLREESAEIQKIFTSDDKPKILRPVLARWQQSVDVLAKIFNVPIAFVIQLQEEALKILVVSKNEVSDFQQGSLLPIHAGGTYCETTIGRGDFFHIVDASKTEEWSEFAKTSTIRSYAGYPIQWPDGESFGALCLLSTEPIEYSTELFHVLCDYQRLIERDLEHLMYSEYVGGIEDVVMLRMREISHRTKNHFAILSNLIQISAAKPHVDFKQALKDIDAKMRTMALLHEMLYSSASLELPVPQFLEDVIKITIQLAPFKTRNTVELSVLPPLDYKYVFDLGLLISELATNSIKYFDRGADEELHISLTCESIDSSTIRLVFRDNGPGFSDEFLEDSDRLGSIGYTMLRSFTRLMNGDFRIYNDNGAVTECTIRA